MNRKLLYLVSCGLLFFATESRSQCSIPEPILTTSTNNYCSELVPQHDPGGEPPVIIPGACWQVCMNSTVVYQAASHPGSTYQWIVTAMPSGAIHSHVDAGNQCTVTFGTIGTATITVIETNGACSSSTSHCVNVLQNPVADFIAPNVQFDPGLNEFYIEVCQWASINFLNNSFDPASSSANVLSQWDFGDGTSSSETSPSHTFTGAGPFKVKLTVTNACGCTDIKVVSIRMMDGIATEIYCADPECAFASASYTVNASGCSTYSWNVVNGTILSPANSNYVQVTWNNGANGPGILSFTGTNCASTCPTTASITIPIFSNNLPITGPVSVCPEPQALYSVPNIPGSPYLWNVSSFGATIVGSACDNEVVVDWTNATPGIPYTLSVTYSNPMLPCGTSSTSTLDIIVGTPFTIDGPQEICNGANANFTIIAGSMPAVPVFTWRVKVVHPDGSINAFLYSQVPGMALNFTPWTYGAGTVYITAIDNSSGGYYCEEDHKETITMKVNGTPPPPSPFGDLFVCPGTSHTYSSTAASGSYLNWSLTGSLTPSPLTGNTVSIQWGTAPYSISLTQVDMLTGCISDPTVLNVSAITPVAPVVTGDMNPCTNSKRTYTIGNISSLHFDQIQISVEPAAAGSLIGLSGSPFQIQWNHYPYPTVNIRIDVTNCGTKTTYTYPVSLDGSAAISISLNTPTPVCEGTGVSFTATGGYPGGNYAWDYGDGLFDVGTAGTVTHAYDLPNGTTAGMLYNVTVTSTSFDGNCKTTGNLAITVYPNPSVSITPSPGCLPTGGSSLLTANISGGPGGTYGFNWSGPLSATTQSVTATLTGTYTVSISNTFNTCAATAAFTLNPCNCTDDPNVTLNVTYAHNASECRTIQFNGGYTNTGSHVLSTTPPPFNWDFGDGNISNAQNPQYTFATGGTHRICFTIYLRDGANNLYCKNTCMFIALPDFSSKIVCPAVAGQNYNVQFTGTDPFSNASPTYTWWNGAANIGSGLNLSTTFAPGTYPIKFETSSGQHCSITKSFTMPLALDASFTATPGPYCEDQTPVQFTAIAANHYHSYFWDYGETDPNPPFAQAQYLSYNNHTSVGYNISNHVFASPSPTGTVNLTVTDVFGCTNSSSNNFFINAMNLAGFVAPASSFICPGNSVTLQYSKNTSTATPTSYLWSTAATTSTISAQQTGQYNVTVSHSTSGCKFMPLIPANVHVHSVPQPVISGKKDICYGDAARLSGNVGAGVNYLWNIGTLALDPACVCSLTSPSIVTQNISPPVLPATYPVSLTITDPGTSCSLTTNANLVVHNQLVNPNITSNPIPACPGTAFNLEVTNNSGAPPYFVNWSNGGSGNTTSTSFSGTYQATFTDQYGCELGFRDYSVLEAPDFSWVLTGCYEMCMDQTFTVPGTSCEYVDQWEWVMHSTNPGSPSYFQNGSGFIQSFSIDNVAFPAISPGIYEIILNVKSNGCEYMRLFKLTVVDCGIKCGIEAPPTTRYGITCLYQSGQTAVYSFSYEFLMGSVNTPSTADLISLSPSAGLVISSVANVTLPNSIVLTGTITCDLSTVTLPTTVQYQFTYTYFDPASGQFILCTENFSLPLEKCDAIPVFCESGDFVGPKITCIGNDLFGNRQYSFEFKLPGMFGGSTNYVVYSYSPDLTLNGFPSTVNSTGPYYGTMTDEQPFLSPGKPACIFMYFIDFTNPDHPVTCYIDDCFVLPECPDPCEVIPCPDRLSSPLNGESPQMSIYPNPAGEHAVVTWQVPDGKWDLQISDLKGQQMFFLPLSSANDATTLDLRQYAQGIYLVSLKSNQSVRLVKKLVIIK